MLDIIAITVPLYAAVLLGYVTTRRGVIKLEWRQAYSTFLVNFAVPAMLFSTIASRPVRDFFHPTYLGGFLLGSFVAFGLAFAISRWWGRETLTAAAFRGNGACTSNSLFIGLPVMMAVLPEVAGAVVGMQLLMENVVVIPMTLLLAEWGRGGEANLRRQVMATLGRTVRNPLIVAMAVGIVFSVARIPVPDVVVRTIDLFARISGGLALFTIGTLLVGAQVRGSVARVSLVAVGKLAVHPLAVWAGLHVMLAVGAPALPLPLHQAALLNAALPMASMSAVIAHTYGDDTVPSAALLVTTFVSFFTLTAAIMFLGISP